MTPTSRVLCLSTDDEFAARVSAPLEYSYPSVSVLTVTDVAEGLEVIGSERLDALVTDTATIDDHRSIVAAIETHRPELSVLVLSSFEDDDRTTAVFELNDVLVDAETDSRDEVLAGWVANSVVSTGRVAGNGPTESITDIVNVVKRSLVDATDPAAVEAAVCDQFVLAEHFEFSWIGEFDRGEGEVVPWATAATGDPWPRSRTFPVRDTEDAVVGRVLRSGSPAFLSEFDADSESVPWAAEAVDAGCTEIAIVPLIAEGEPLGIFAVYTSGPEGFSVNERAALSDVGDTMARVLQAMAMRGRVDQQERILRRHERLVETVGDGMYALDAEGHFMTVNDALCDLTGYAREGLLGEHVGLVLDEAGLTAWRNAVESLREFEGEKRSLECAVQRKDGGTVACENKVGLLPSDEDGEPRGTVGVLRDVTERNRREAELRRQNERLDAFASVVSHDLRNPLSVADGYLDLAMDEIGGDHPAHDSLEAIDESLARMNELIDDVLALARDREPVRDPDPVDLEDLARDAWSNVDTDEATLSVAASGSIPVDRSRVARLFENLFRNAVQHGGSDVSVTVGTLDAPRGASAVGSSDDVAGFYVADDGPGMDESIRDRVFESEFTTDEEGHGIGLWVVREVADAHGWDCEATVAESGGARFEFRFE